ncbi:site-specific integrase [uncultured Draconibacterium sp.]|uniref:tyrosine-type recombinase/integrase n=1 Tax=uncultured Draconibacterium sp. TaxID=1573823 RepID=UPI003217750C
MIFPDQDVSQLKARGVSLVAFLDTARIRKDGTATVKLRIVHDRFPKYYSTKVNMDEHEYQNMFSHRPKHFVQEKKRIILAFLKRAYNLILANDDFSFDSFDAAYRKRTITNNVFTYFDSYIEQLKTENRFGTATSYTYASKSLSEYTGKSTLAFDSITVPSLKSFENWIIQNGNSPTTVGYHVRCIKKLYNDAIRNGDAKQANYPFGAFKNGLYSPPQPQNIKKALSMSQIKSIVDYKALTDSEERYRDMWVFSYLGNGINMKDICRLQFKHIVGGNIHFHRAKTVNTNRNSKPISIPLIDEIKSIIERWGNGKLSPETYIFPVLDGTESAEKERAKIQQFTKQVNKYIKRIALKVGIEENVSTYSARHSFATVLKRSGVNIPYISEALGHSNLKTTESYLDSFEDDTRVENTMKLLDFD